MAGYVYFFKHIDIKGVKVGCTTKKDVKDRFSSFNVASPYGAEIKAVIPTKNPFALEKIIHDEMSAFRMNGEFFDLSDAMISHLVAKHGKKSERLENILSKIKFIYNSSNEEEKNVFMNHMHICLKRYSLNMHQSEDPIRDQVLPIISESFEPCTDEKHNLGLTCTEIMEELFPNDNNLTIRKLGTILRSMGFTKKSIRKEGKVKQCYLIYDKRNKAFQ